MRHVFLCQLGWLLMHRFKPDLPKLLVVIFSYQDRQVIVTELTMQQEVWLVALILLVLVSQLQILRLSPKLFSEFLRVINACRVIRSRKDVPCGCIMGIYLGCLGAKSHNSIVVFVFDFECLLVGLKILELPSAQFLVALAKEMRINVLAIRENYFQLTGRSVACVVLVINVIWDCNLDLGHIVCELTLLLMDHKLRHALFLLLF